MSVPASREELKDWCLRQLGHPVVKINIDEDQLDDRIDEAFQFFRDFHYDGVERVYSKYQITQQDIDNQYIPVGPTFTGVTKIFSMTNSNTSMNMFDMRYQLRLHDLYDFTSVSYVNYELTMQHIRTLDMLFVGEQPIRFNKLTNKLFIDWNWKSGAIFPGQWIIIEGFAIVDPEQYTEVYNDRMLKKLCVAYIKKQWGTNMKKYGGLQLPGGIVLNGKETYDEAVLEIDEIEKYIRNTYSDLPSAFLMG